MNKIKKDRNHTILVDNVFSSIHKNYDLMNDVMSLGSHRLFKRQAMKNCVNGNLLDLAAGTGDLTIYYRTFFGSEQKVTLADPNSDMLIYAKHRLDKKHIYDNLEYVTTYAEKLPFANDSFNNVSIGFGIRNFTDKEKSLKEIYRVLKQNGKLVIIDFSKPTNIAIRFFGSIYLKYFVPTIAKIFIRDNEEYHYLAKSVAEHPAQLEIIKLMEAVGFKNCNYNNKLNGIIAIHLAEK